MRHLVQFGSSFAHRVVVNEASTYLLSRMVIEDVATKRFYESFYAHRNETPYEYDGEIVTLEEVFPHEVTKTTYTTTPN